MAVRSAGGPDLSLYALKTDVPASQILPGTFAIQAANAVGGVQQLPDAAAVMLGMYAVVVDLFEGTTDKVLCAKSGSAFYWRAVRPDFTANMPIAADMTLVPLRHASRLFLTGTLPGLGLNRTLTLSPANAYGASFEIVNGMSGLGTLRIGGLHLGSLVSTVLGATTRYAFDATVAAWRQVP